MGNDEGHVEHSSHDELGLGEGWLTVLEDGSARAEARAHVFVTGLVQGVNFRANARAAAIRAGVAGWVRNLSDGRVEAAFEGAEGAVRGMVDWCRQGPRGAVVRNVEAAWEEPRGERGFVIRY